MLYTSATTFNRVIFGVLLAFILAIQSVYAQIDIDDMLIEDNGDYEIILRVPMNEVVFDATPFVGDFIEGVARVAYATVPVHTYPNRTSQIVRLALPGEMVMITSNNGEWFGVRMFNGRLGFVERHRLRTVRIFFDESITTNHMNKRLNIELHDIIQRFNRVMSESIYLEKFHIVPRFTMSNSSMFGGTIAITLEYSAVDINGNIIPSRQVNDLRGELQNFIELIFMKMLTVRARSYVINIKQPQFSSNGRVLNMNGEYATLTLVYDDTITDRMRSPNRNILGLVTSTMPINDLFRMYPH